MDPRSLVPGDRIGDYILDQKIGEGGFAQVWKARNAKWKNQIVALKIPLETEYIRNLRDEGKIQHEIESPHIVKFIETDLSCEPPWLAMEFVRGKSLREILQEKKRLTQSEALNIIFQTARGLAAAHAKNVEHRDIKPENIMITDKGLVKLTDFGLGAHVEETSKSLDLSGVFQTATGSEVSGTLAYMSPEQIDPELSVDTRTDIYSIGIVLFETLTGSRPQGAEVPSDLAPELDRRLDAIFKKCYTRADHRYQKIEEFLKDIKSIRKSEPEQNSTEDELKNEESIGPIPILAQIFTKRAVAMLIDASIVLIPVLLISFSLVTETKVTDRARLLGDTRETISHFPLFTFIFLFALAWFSYFFIFNLKLSGRTPGKILLGLKVKFDFGPKIEPKTAAMRSAYYLLSIALFGAGFLMPLAREDGKTLHDLLSNTSVVPNKDK